MRNDDKCEHNWVLIRESTWQKPFVNDAGKVFNDIYEAVITRAFYCSRDPTHTMVLDYDRKEDKWVRIY